MAWMEIAEVSTLGLASCSIVATLFTSGRRTGVARRALATSATILCVLMAGWLVARDLQDLPHQAVTPLGWWAWIATTVAAGLMLWDAHAHQSLPNLYALGLALLSQLLVLRDLSPGRFVVWSSICELTGFAIVAALVGWLVGRFPGIFAALRLPRHLPQRQPSWLHWAQAGLMWVSTLLLAWILIDPAFDGMGTGIALLGLAGHRAANPAALMLLGATLLMAWQSSSPWRGRWQYAAFGAGLLFTTSVSWAGIEPGAAETWPQRVVALLISTAMMTFLTRFGLARALPRAGDWLVRARRASLWLATMAAVMGVLALLHAAGRWS